VSRFVVGDALDVVRTLPDASVDLVATSPPFLALRDYGAMPGQWGQELTPAAFLDHLLTLTVELRRVLAPHGSLAVELGDTYSGAGGAGGDYNADGMRAGQLRWSGSAAKRAKLGRQENDRPSRSGRGDGWPIPKSLCGTPTLFAWSLAYGRNLLNPEHEFEPWLVRNVIAWARNNPPRGRLADKVGPATSYITVACPSGKRWYDLDAVRAEPAAHTLRYPRAAEHYSNAGYKPATRGDQGRISSNAGNPAGSPPLDHWHDEIDGDLLWLINTQGSSLSHYAMWPPTLAERLILMMCPAEVCRTCNEPRRRVVARDTGALAANARKRGPTGADNRASGGSFYNAAHFHSPRTSTIGWSDCGHDDYRPGVVLDPFCGTGTTLAVAEVHGRDSIGIDLDPANESLLGPRRDQVRKALLGVSPEVPGQLDLGV